PPRVVLAAMAAGRYSSSPHQVTNAAICSKINQGIALSVHATARRAGGRGAPCKKRRHVRCVARPLRRHLHGLDRLHVGDEFLHLATGPHSIRAEACIPTAAYCRRYTRARHYAWRSSWARCLPQRWERFRKDPSPMDANAVSATTYAPHWDYPPI